MTESFGFIILRHVNNQKTARYWIKCYENIRKHYTNKILIIDDNSDYKFIPDQSFLVNCQIIKSEFLPQRAEILPYYYLYKTKIFEKCAILHDTVFIQNYIDFNAFFDNDCSAHVLWHIPQYFASNKEREIYALSKLKKDKELIEFYNTENSWIGCFGSMSLITYNFIVNLQNKYGIFDFLLQFVDSRRNRETLERIMGILICKENRNTKSVYGNCFENLPYAFSLRYDKYMRSCDVSEYDIVKIWSGHLLERN